MPLVTVGRWGESLALRLPADLAGRLSLVEGETVEVEQREDEIVIRKSAPALTLEDLFKGKSPAEWRALYAGSYDWVPDVGREVVDE